MSLLPLDGPSAQLTLSVNTVTVQEAKVGASPLSERKAVTIQPLNGKVYIYFGDDSGSTPLAAIVSANGMVIYKNGKETYEASASQRIYLLSTSGTTSVVVVERS